MEMVQKKRPKHLNLVKIKQPVNAIVSILHRVSGVALFLSLPLLLSLLQNVLGTPDTFAYAKQMLANPLLKLVLFGLLWAFLHHFCAGLRFLALDLHWGIDIQSARTSATVVLAVSLALTVIMGVLLW